MKEPTIHEYLDSLKSISGLLVGVGVLIPAVSYFTSFTPPLLEASSLFTTAVALATLLGVFYYRFRPVDLSVEQGFSRVVRRSMQMMAAAVLSLFCYLLLLRFTTVMDPRGESRFQVGFYKLDWSLTGLGRTKAKDLTLEDWMMSGAYFRDGGPEVIWTLSTIYFAGGLLVVLFTTTFVLWTAGWAMLAKQHAYDALKNKNLALRREAAALARKSQDQPEPASPLR